MKRFISFIFCLILLIGIIVPASATNVDAIVPDGTTYITGVADKDIPCAYHISPYDAGPGTYVIIPSNNYVTIEQYNALLEELQQTQNAQATETNDNDDIVTLPEDKEPSIEYQTTYNSINEEIFALINQVRQNNNLPVLTYNKNLQAAADLRAKESAIQFSHTRPDGSSCHSVITGDYFVVGENLLKADPELSTASMMVDTWMNSKSHRDNILLQHFTETAIGVYVADDNVTYVAQLFKG